MAMKCVAQMPHPVARLASPIQTTRARPRVAHERWNRLTATKLVRKQTPPASTTSRQSCSTVRQLSTRNIYQYPPIRDAYRHDLCLALIGGIKLRRIPGNHTFHVGRDEPRRGTPDRPRPTALPPDLWCPA